MRSIQLKSHIGADGLLQVELPDCQEQDVEVLIVYQPVQKPIKRQWSQAFLSTAGSWQGESLIRESQPVPTDRESLQ